MRFLLALPILIMPILAEDKPDQPLNRLSKESSPYLRQHASNPVDWYSWGEEAFAKARKENKPIFISVGYSTCHWCHVMARESFANKEIAAVMNEHFINIKHDREERPDVDQVYMTFVQASTGSGGWPLNVWLTPDLKPFVGGTYFPPEDSEGRPGFKSILLQLASAWEKDEKTIREQAGQVVDELKKMTTAQPSADKTLPDAAVFEAAYNKFLKSFDSEYGGFDSAPKFPRVSTHDLLHHLVAAKVPNTEKALEMSNTTLDAINRGGIRDHLGGGFHRYSVDRFWHVPHYEKMLYDQAQLAIAFIESNQLKSNPSFVAAARDIFRYVDRKLTHSDGGFFSAEDADSMASPDADHKTEGAFYIWTKSEIDGLLGDDAELFNAIYGVEESGNSPAGSDPHGDLKNQNTLTPFTFRPLDPVIEQLLLACTAVSMGIVPSLMNGAGPFGRWLEVKGLVKAHQKAPPRLEPGKAIKALEDHAVICGYGPVGRALNEALQRCGVETLVLELNADAVRELKKAGQRVLFADATHPGALDLAGIERARMVAFTFPAVDLTVASLPLVRDRNHGICVFARAKFANEVEQLKQLDVHVIHDEQESGGAMIRAAMSVYQRAELEDGEVRDIVDQQG